MDHACSKAVFFRSLRIGLKSILDAKMFRKCLERVWFLVLLCLKISWIDAVSYFANN